MTEKELQEIFSSNIHLFRTRLKLTQAKLANKIGVSINFLNDVERGKKWASPKTMVKFANVFNVKVYELLKPMDILPDNYSGVIEKFAEDVHASIEQIRTTLLENEKQKKQSE